jgi:hypothetical protein
MANMILTECSGCGTVVAAEAIAQYSAVLNPQLGATERITFARCRKCDSPFLVGEEFFGGGGGGTDGTEAWSDPYRVYPSRDELLRPKLPPTVQNPYREAINCIKAQAYSAATMMCYRTLDAACIEHNISEATLAESLKEMRTQGVIEPRLFEWAEALPAVMNTTGPQADSAVSRNDASDVLAFTDAFLAYLYSFRNRYHGFLKRRTRVTEQRPPLHGESTAASAVAAGAASRPSNGDRPQ